MNAPAPLLYGLLLCFFLLEACGPTAGVDQQAPQPAPVKQGGGLVEDEVIQDANFSIETTETYGGLSSGCRCDDDNAYGYGGTSNLLTNDGNRYLWWGCWRAGNLSDPNRGMRCSTGGETVHAIEPASWALIKKDLLGLKLQNLAGNYDCYNTSSPCYADTGGPTHDITIDGQNFSISYDIDSEYLPPNLQRLEIILRSIDASQSQ